MWPLYLLLSVLNAAFAIEKNVLMTEVFEIVIDPPMFNWTYEGTEIMNYKLSCILLYSFVRIKKFFYWSYKKAFLFVKCFFHVSSSIRCKIWNLTDVNTFELHVLCKHLPRKRTTFPS